MTDNIDILLKLFETLKESSDKNEDATQQLIVQQLELVSCIKNLPIEDLRAALKEHAKQSADDIDDCTETVETKSVGLMDEIKKISSKVNKMILVVTVAFSLLAGTYIFVRSSYDSGIKFQEWQDRIEKRQRTEHSILVDEITKQIKEGFKNLKNKP